VSGAFLPCASVCYALLLADCTQESVDKPANVGGTKQNIIAGFAASDSALDAIGSVSMLEVYGESKLFQQVCTGTLIDDDTVLTAKHCVDALNSDAGYSGYTAVFTLGPDASAPARYVEVIALERGPGVGGGFNDLGHDVGVLHLAEPIKDVKPIPYADIDPNTLGWGYTAIGYGEQDNSEKYGTRRLGELSLRALTGSAYGALFGSFEAFYEWYAGEPLPPECVADGTDAGVVDAGAAGTGGSGGDSGVDPYLCSSVSSLREIYDSALLETEHELVAGGVSGNAQPCYGDSGGPLLRKDSKGQLVTYGVVSGGLGSPELVCDHGAVYEAFDSEALAFLDAAKSWVDPCQGIAADGQCDGTVAVRCSTLLEGKRRKLSYDCARVNLECKIQAETGEPGCGTDDHVLPDPPAKSNGRAPDRLTLERKYFREASALRPVTK
jgi:hypothetical protein